MNISLPILLTANLFFSTTWQNLDLNTLKTTEGINLKTQTFNICSYFLQNHENPFTPKEYIHPLNTALLWKQTTQNEQVSLILGQFSTGGVTTRLKTPIPIKSNALSSGLSYSVFNSRSGKLNVKLPLSTASKQPVSMTFLYNNNVFSTGLLFYNLLYTPLSFPFNETYINFSFNPLYLFQNQTETNKLLKNFNLKYFLSVSSVNIPEYCEDNWYYNHPLHSKYQLHSLIQELLIGYKGKSFNNVTKIEAQAAFKDNTPFFCGFLQNTLYIGYFKVNSLLFISDIDFPNSKGGFTRDTIKISLSPQVNLFTSKINTDFLLAGFLVESKLTNSEGLNSISKWVTILNSSLLYKTTPCEYELIAEYGVLPVNDDTEFKIKLGFLYDPLGVNLSYYSQPFKKDSLSEIIIGSCYIPKTGIINRIACAISFKNYALVSQKYDISCLLSPLKMRITIEFKKERTAFSLSGSYSIKNN